MKKKKKNNIGVEELMGNDGDRTSILDSLVLSPSITRLTINLKKK